MAPEIAQEGQTVVVQDSAAAADVVAQVLTDPNVSPCSPAVPRTVVERWEVELARSAGSRLTETIPHKTSQELAEELLQRLLEERSSRELQNLNHWPQYAPGYLNTLVRGLANKEAWRRRKVAAFFETNYERARAYASRFLSVPEDIDEMVGAAFELLQDGRVDFENFYPKIRDLCVDRLRRMEVERDLFVSLDALIDDNRSAEEGLDDDLPGLAAPTPKYWEQEPLSQLMDRRNRRANPLMVGRAKKDADWRFVRRNNWATELREGCAKTAPSNG